MKRTKNKEKIGFSKRNIVYTVCALILLSLVMVIMLTYMAVHTKEEAYSNLKIQTESVKNDINLQMMSDRENLLTMANFAANLYEQDANFSLLFTSFEEIGMLEKVRILLPDGTLFTKKGTFHVGDRINYEEEVKKGQHVTGRVQELTEEAGEVIRSAVPIVSNGETVGMLYGVIRLSDLEKRFGGEAENLGAGLLIVEGVSGKYIVNTVNNHLGNITGLASAEYEEGFSFETLLRDITEGNHGYASFRSVQMPEYHYTYYDDLNVSDWRILLAKPKSVVFSKAKTTGAFILFIVALVVLITLGYMLVIFRQERSKNARKSCASSVRKQLLQFNNRAESVHTALQEMTEFIGSRSTFFIDTLGENYFYISPEASDKILNPKERKQLASKLLVYVAGQATEPGGDVAVYRIKVDEKLSEEFPEFYNFALKHAIKRISFAAVSNRNMFSFLGMINPKKHEEALLLKDVAVCFSMSVYNKKHLDRTEEMALTDSLTGVANRMAYNQTLKQYSGGVPQELICVYIDVNELHYFNNTFGHAAGDQMLIFIANAMKRQFPEGELYRMGGDEFLVFVQNLEEQEVAARIRKANQQIEEMKYHISVGVSYGAQFSEMEGLVTEAEKRMYENKAFYYQQKNQNKIVKVDGKTIEHLTTGNSGVDAVLDIASRRYNGIYCVSLETDEAVPILIPAYLKPYSDRGDSFSSIYGLYVGEAVKPEYQRMLMEYLRYDILKKQLDQNYVPSMVYDKNNGEKVRLCIYRISTEEGDSKDTLWVFERLND